MSGVAHDKTLCSEFISHRCCTVIRGLVLRPPKGRTAWQQDGATPAEVAPLVVRRGDLPHPLPQCRSSQREDTHYHRTRTEAARFTVKGI